jgi:hypothetical protein
LTYWSSARALPALCAPPVFSEARLWLDASGESTFTTDAQGGVLSWADKSGNGNDAVTYDGATLGVVGLTNGVPAFLMGDTGTGIDLKFPRMADIRSVFWVMDVSRKTEAVFLADSTKNYKSHDFLRTDDAVFKWDCKAFTGDLWFDDMWLYSWSMKRWSVKDGHLPAGTAVYSLSCGTDLTADRLSWPKDASAAIPVAALCRSLLSSTACFRLKKFFKSSPI